MKTSKPTSQADVTPVTLNNASTAWIIKTNSLYSLPLSFYFWQVLGLVLSGSLFLWLSSNEQLDWFISNYWFDPVGQNFPWENNYWLDLLNHRLLKITIISTAVMALLWGIYRRNGRLITTMLLFGIGPLVVGVLKAFSAHSCPLPTWAQTRTPQRYALWPRARPAWWSTALR